MTYLSYINERIRAEVTKHSVVMYGQNITRGSCLGGLTRGIEAGKGGRTINTTNAENTLTGLGFGMLLEGQPSIFFMKQMDFLLLGVDQLVNTYNNIRSTRAPDTLGSYTIFPITVDSGYQGPQSSLNTLADFCTIAKLRGYTLTNKWDTDRILSQHLISPGMRLITVSQRQFSDELLALPEPLYVSSDDTVFQYAAGSAATIVSFNFALPQALKLHAALHQAGIAADLFNVNSPADFDTTRLIERVRATKKVIILDDSKTDNLPHRRLLEEEALGAPWRLVIKRELGENWLYPVPDVLGVDYEKVVAEIGRS